MFGNNKKKEVTTKRNGLSAAAPSNSLNSLVQGTVVEGTVKSESDIRIDGTIKGTMVCKDKVIIGPKGFVEGEIKCANAVVEGRFEGILNVSELLNVRDSAEVKGEVNTNKLIVASGAVFTGSCQMSSKSSSNGMGTFTKETNSIGNKAKSNVQKFGEKTKYKKEAS